MVLVVYVIFSARRIHIDMYLKGIKEIGIGGKSMMISNDKLKRVEKFF